MIFSWKQEMSLSESETVYRSLAITIYLNIYYKKNDCLRGLPRCTTIAAGIKIFGNILFTLPQTIKSLIREEQTKSCECTCECYMYWSTDFLFKCYNFLGLLHETKGKQNKKSNKKTYKIHVEMKRKNRSLLKSGVWWDNRYVISVRLYIFL